MKKVLSLVLVIAMVLSSMSFAFAGTFTDIADTDYTKAIETLTALGVVTGYEDGTYRPEKVVTRAEMAKLIVEILGYGNLVAGSKSNFTDTQGHWADAWIALAAGKGLVVGTGEGKFTPDRTVSYDEAITMVVRALGYTDTCNELKSMSWPTNFKVKAAELKLTKDVKLASTGADRGGVAQLLYNALTATLVTVNSDGDVIKSTTQTTDAQGKVVVEYTELLSRIAVYDSNYNVDPDKLDEKSKNYAGDKVDLAPYMYQNLKVYLNDDDEVVYVKGTNSVLVEGKVADILDKNNKSYADADAGFAIAAGEKVTLVVEDANEKEFKVAVTDSVKVFYNGEEETIQVEDFTTLLYDKVVAKVAAIVNDADKDGNVDNGEVVTALVAEKATKAILVKNDYTGKVRIVGNNANITLPSEDGDVLVDSITVVGAVDSLEDIKADDVVVAYESISTDIVKLVVVRDVVEGEVTKTNSGLTSITVNGKSYSTSKLANSVRYLSTSDKEKVLSVGSEGVFYLDNNGSIFAVDTEGAALTDYAIVLGTPAAGEWSNKMDGSVTDYPQIKLLTQEGETVIYKVLVSVDENAIDDYAIYTNNKVSNVKDQQLVQLDAIAAGQTKGSISFIPTLATNELIKYSVDENGYIDEIEIMKTTANVTIDTDDIEDIASADCIVFNTVDKEIAKLDSLKDNTSHTVLYDDGEIIVIVTSNVESVNDGVFGVITGLSYVKNSSGKTVTEVRALVDGEEVTYLANSKITIGTNNFAATTTAAAYKFTFNSNDTVKQIDPIASADVQEVVIGNATDVSTKYITVGNTFKFAGSAVVYIYDESDDEITLGDISDLDENRITAVYNTTSTDGIANIIVQVQP